MKRFRFQLESVLDYKGRVLDDLMTELGVLRHRVSEQEHTVSEARTSLAEYAAEYEEKKRAGMDVVEALEYQSGQEYLARVLVREERELELRQKQAEEKRQEVVEARQDTRTLERLKELRRREYDDVARKEEERFLDDLVASRRAIARAEEAG